MNTFKARDGRVLAWSGRNVCVCTRCVEIFNSVAAFDAHIRRGKHLTPEKAGLVRNKKGYLVTKAWEDR